MISKYVNPVSVFPSPITLNNLRYVFAYTCISSCIKLGQFYFPSLNLWQDLNVSNMKIFTKIKYDRKKIISRFIKARRCRKVPSITFWPQGDPNPGTPRVYEILSKGASGVKQKTGVGVHRKDSKIWNSEQRTLAYEGRREN